MIKYLALDIYGTILPTNNPNLQFGHRKGSFELLENCKDRDIRIVGVLPYEEDAVSLELMTHNLSDYFSEVSQYSRTPDFPPMIERLGIDSPAFLAIGTVFGRGVVDPRKIPFNYIKVSDYNDPESNKHFINSVLGHSLYMGLVCNLFVRSMASPNE